VLPPDRAQLGTEGRNPRSLGLHQASVAECVRLIQREDHAVLAALAAAQPALIALIEAIEPRFCAGGRLVYIGAGTSGRLGVLDASEAPPTFQVDPNRIIAVIAGGDGALRRSSEGQEDDPQGAVPAMTALDLCERDTLIGIAAGGTTPYVLGALAFASTLASRPLTAFIACCPTPKPAHADHLIILDTGAEVITGSTRMKAGTATKLALNTLSTTLMVRSGKVFENLMVDVRASNAKLRDRAARIIASLTGLDRSASFTLLDAAGGQAKTAIVMHRLGLGRDQAEAALATAQGRLDRLLG
jgi:N-acetylmuramic acid 6-phosphate etherase